MGIIPWILDTVYNSLPDFSGILLAAVGVAMIFAPEDWVKRIGRTWRWTIAGVLVTLGLLGMRSSFTQHRDADQVQRGLGNKMDDLQRTSDGLQIIVKSYGPKLDAIMANPQTPDQKELAQALKNELKPKIQVDEPALNEANPVSFVARKRNVGGSVAKGVTVTSNAVIAVQGSWSEERLFDWLYSHEKDSDIKPMDMHPGDADQSTTRIDSRPPISANQVLQMKTNQALYVGVLVTYFDEQGRKYHTERCIFSDSVANHLDRFCDGHNVTY